MKHLKELSKILGQELHENPSRMTALATMPYLRGRENREIRSEMMKGPDDESLDEAIARLSDLTEKNAHSLRVQALENLSKIVREKFPNVIASIRWLYDGNIKLGTWCGVQVARYTLEQIKTLSIGSVERRAIQSAEYTAEVAERWVRGEATLKAIEREADDARGDASALFLRNSFAAYEALYAMIHASEIPKDRNAIFLSMQAAADALSYKEYKVTSNELSSKLLIELNNVAAESILGFPVDLKWNKRRRRV